MAGFLSKLLSQMSGNTGLKMSEQLLFDKVIGFRGVVSGVGTSTLIQNVAIALSESTSFSICVLDTSFMYPTMYPMLVRQSDQKRVDYLDFNTELSDIVVGTAFKNVTLVSLNNRSVIDMISSKDNEAVLEKLIGSLKSYFDVILVDLSYEMTNISVHASIKCNKIVNVADYSLKCVYNLRKSLNTMSTLGVPLAKANTVVINKVVPDVLTSVKSVIENSGLYVIGEIPFSIELARLGVSGKRIYSASSSIRDVVIFSDVIETVLRDSIKLTPLSDKYVAKDQSSESTSTDQDTFVEDDVTVEELLGELNTFPSGVSNIDSKEQETQLTSTEIEDTSSVLDTENTEEFNSSTEYSEVGSEYTDSTLVDAETIDDSESSESDSTSEEDQGVSSEENSESTREDLLDTDKNSSSDDKQDEDNLIRTKKSVPDSSESGTDSQEHEGATEGSEITLDDIIDEVGK